MVKTNEKQDPELDTEQEKHENNIERFKRRKGSERFFYKAKERVIGPIKPWLYEPTALSEKGEELNTGKLGLLSVAALATVAGVFIVSMYGLRSGQAGPKMSVTPASVPQVASKPPEPRLGPPQPQKKLLVPAPQEIRPAPLPPPNSSSPTVPKVDAKALAEQRLQEAKAEADKRVSSRQANREPLLGSTRVSNLPQLPPPPISPLGGRPVIQTVAYNPGQQNLSGQAPVPLAFRGAPGGPFPTQVSQNIPVSSLAPAQAVPTLQGGVQQNWNLLGPGNLMKAQTRSVIQSLKSFSGQSAGQSSPVFAQVMGAVRVDGQVVIPDGATLSGNVVAVDDALGRVRVEFTSLTIGQRSIPLRGASAWTIQNTGSTDALSEGLVADVGRTTNPLGTDGTVAVEQAAGSVAQNLGQTTTTTVNPFTGTPMTISSNTGDLENTGRRAIAQGVSGFFRRTVERSDRQARAEESRGPILSVPAGREFVVYLKDGV